LNPVLDLAAKWAAPYAEVRTVNDNGLDMKYFVLVILTDGGVQDQQLAVDTLLEMSGFPISVVMIEMGDEHDHFLANVKAEVKANQALRDFPERDFITTMRYNDTKGNPRSLRHRTLYKLAEDVSNYFKAIDVLPRDLGKYEDERGIPVPRPKVESAPPDEMQEEELRNAANLAGKPTEGELDLLDAFHAGERELEAAIARLPKFLQDKRMEILESAVALGYPKTLAWRVLKEGLADDSLEVLVDNILHAGHGKSSTFKDAIQEVRKKKSRQTASRQTTKDTRVTTKEGIANRGSDRATTPLEPITDDPEASLPGTVPSSDDARAMATSKELSGQVSSTSKELSTYSSRLSSKLLDQSRSKHSSKEVSFQGSRNVSKEVGFVSGRQVRASKDPPSSAGGSTMGRPASPPEGRSALRKKGSTKDSNGSFRSDGTDQLHVSLPGAVEYYDSKPAQRATTPMITKCSICLERKINVEFIPCGHRLACDQCADSVGQICPLCRTPLRGRKSI